ncbi:MAG: pilQ [Gammaproteobacteria bacterium]|nr:pilQ [Gammaproteobacteria bacterium]
MPRKKIFFITLFFSLFYPYFSHAQSNTPPSKKISLDLQNMRLQDALRIIAKSLDNNIVISSDIHGLTSLHLKQVSPLEALDLLLASNALSKWRIGHIWYIVPRAELIQRKQEELKLHTIVDETAPLETRVWQLHYSKAEDIAHLLQDNNHSLLSKYGHVHIDVRTNIICIQDIEEHLHEMEGLIRRLDVPVQQVLIEVHLANIDNDFERALGIHLEPQATSSEEDPSPFNIHYGLAILKLTDGSLLHMQLSALENEGHGELISNPSLFTANQQTAFIESGEEIPYQEISRSGATGVAFKKAVLSLRVTPQVMPGNQILLQLQVNQDKPSNRIVLGVPAITTRQINTHILIKSGQTVVLGGIYEENKDNQQQGIPFLCKIPLVGWLFKQQNVTHNKRELLIFVTPRIII